MIRLFDYKCSDCSNIQEEYITTKEIPKFGTCNICKEDTIRIVSLGGMRTNTVDSPWIKLTSQIADPKSNEPHIKEFRKHPTRANLKTFLEKSNLRIGDKAEPNYPVINHEARDNKMKKQMIQMDKDRNAVRVGGL